MVKKVVLSLGVALSLLLGTGVANVQATEAPTTAQEVVDQMGVGWNLGNALDSYSYSKGSSLESETWWGNPKTTKKMIDAVADAGFQSIRIPVTYYNHLDENNQIDSAWLDRVEEVVNYALDNDLYVVMNVHHDTGMSGWIYSDTDSYETDKAALTNLWSQIATRFKDYDDRLLFEGTNEILNSDNNWDWGVAYKDFQVTHDLNQDFINTVRSTGGNNANRYLVVSTWAASSDSCQIEQLFYKNFDDTVEDKLIMSVHNYSTSSSTITSFISKLKQYSDTYGIPVIIDEFGTKSTVAEETRVSSASYYVSTAKENGITCFVWDNGGDYQLLDRNKCCWSYPSIVEAIITAAGGTYTPKVYDNLKTIDFSDINNWRAGHYNNTNGNYQTFSGRICLNDYVTIDKKEYKVTAPANYYVLIREFTERGTFLGNFVLADGDSYTLSDDAGFIGISLYNEADANVSVETYQTLLASGEITFAKESGITILSKITSSDKNVWFSDTEVPVNNYTQIQVKGTLKGNWYYDVLNAAGGKYVFRIEKDKGLFRRVSWWNNKVANVTEASHIDITQAGKKTYTTVDGVSYEENLNPGSAFNATGVKINLSYFDFESASVTDENGVLLRDYVPALDENDQVCIYEKVSGTCYALPANTYTYE